MMNILRASATLLMFLCLFLPFRAPAELKPGDKAPDFSVDAAIGGKDIRFSLAEALRQGPVIVYFYPKSFTQGCTVEAHLFAEAAERIRAAGASLIGISADTIETQKAFSAKECRDKFPVGADPDLKVIRAYDAVFVRLPGVAGLSDRSSYVIAPDGTIIWAYSDSAPENHVENALRVVENWRNSTR